MNDWLKLVILAGVLAGSYGLHKYFETKAVNNAITVTTTKIETEYKTKLIAAQTLASNQTAALNTYKAKADLEKTNAVKAVDDKYAGIVSELQKRPTRSDLTSSIATAVASARQACTGAQLFREDGEFLAGEAARADKVIIQRDYYYGQYENARRTLAGEKPDAGLNAATDNSKSVLGIGIHGN